MRVAVDGMGGDNAPAVEVEGAVSAAREFGIAVILVGDRDVLQKELDKYNCAGLDISIVHASEVVGMHDSASDAIRRKKDSSIRIAFDLVKEGKADAVVSAGNSGATMAAGMFILGRLKGIDRPAIATIFPSLRGKTLVLDVGGNVDCKPQNLVQFAIMGEVYAKYFLDIQNPRVGLLSNGEEECKGNELTREANSMLRGSPFNYLGYVEGRDIFKGSADVVVFDGFVGNIVLKLSEGLVEAVGKMLKEEIRQSILSKVGYLFVRRAFRNFRKKVDYSEYGGAPLLGINGVGMICHGGSSVKAIKNAIRFAHDYARKGVNQKMAEKMQDYINISKQPRDEAKDQAVG
jgi:glycerol-3-phosphate acyltransferase PlsX